jgi:hypothetical protein
VTHFVNAATNESASGTCTHDRGKLAFLCKRCDALTEVSLHMDRLVAEQPAEPRSPVQTHLVSVFGGDQEVGAIAAAMADEQRFQISLPGGAELFGFLDEKPVMYRASLQILDPALPAAAEALITIQKTDVAETTTWIRPAAPAVQLSLF